MKKIILFVALSIALFGKIEVSYLSVEGVGDTRSEAIKNGLIEAVKQTNGVNISSKRQYYKSINEVAVLADGDSTHAVSISEKTKHSIREATNGFIRNYSIEDAYRQDGDWHVLLKIKFKRYKTPGLNPNKRRKIAIIPFSYKNSYVILGQNSAGEEVSDRFTQALVTKITQARKFTVLDRENSKFYQSEKNFILSKDTNKEEFLKLGKRLGTDYLLIGKILDFSLDNITQSNNIGLPETSALTCSATISYRILAMATQQIKWSETISKNFEIEQKPNENSAEAIIANASDKIAGTILENILSNIYPAKVVAVTSRSIIVNQGGNSIQEGDRYKVYRLGEKLVDPYTHESLGREEIKVGEIEITEVKPKVSYARALYGKIAKGMILRKVKSDANHEFQSDGEAVTDVKINQNGGVVLPF